MKIDEKMREQLRAPLPSEALSPHPTKSYLTTIKAIYVVERLNDVFGVGGWKVTNTFVEKVDKMVVVHSVFTCGDIYVEAYGGNDNPDLGDAYKGACTDALTKIGSYLEIGMSVFKGLETNKVSKTTNVPSQTNNAPQSANSGVICDLCGSPMVKRNGKRGEFYGCSAYPKCTNIKEVADVLPTVNYDDEPF